MSLWYKENDQILLGRIKKDLDKEIYFIFLKDRFKYSKDILFYISEFNKIPIKIPQEYFTKLNQNTSFDKSMRQEYNITMGWELALEIL